MQLFPRSIEKYLSKVKGPVIIYVEVAGGGRKKYIGKIKNSLRPPLQTM